MPQKNSNRHTHYPRVIATGQGRQSGGSALEKTIRALPKKKKK